MPLFPSQVGFRNCIEASLNWSLVVAPVEEEIACGGVYVHVPADARELVENPSDVARLRLGKRVSAMVSLVDGLVGCQRRCGCCSRMEVSAEIPEEIIIAIDVDTDCRVNASCGVRGISILAPQRVGFLVVPDTIGIDQREEDDAGVQCFDHVGLGIALRAVRQAGRVFLSEQQVRDEVDEIIRATAFSGVNSGGEVDVVRVGIYLARHSALSARSLGSSIGYVKCRDSVFVGKPLDRGIDFIGIHDGADIAVPAIRSRADTLRRNLPTLESIAFADRGFRGSLPADLVKEVANIQIPRTKKLPLCL